MSRSATPATGESAHARQAASGAERLLEHAAEAVRIQEAAP